MRTLGSCALLRGLPLTLLLLLALPRESNAEILVEATGPHSGQVRAIMRRLLAQARVTSALVRVRLWGGRPTWMIAVAVFRPGAAQPSLAQTVRVRRWARVVAALRPIAARTATLLGQAKAAAPPPLNPPSEEDSSPPEDNSSPPEDNEAPAPPSEPAPLPETTAPPAAAAAEPEPEPREEERESAAPPAMPERTSIEPEPTVTRRAKERPGLFLIRVELGADVAWRRFTMAVQNSSLDFASGTFSQLNVGGELYPLALLTRSPFARLGIQIAYEYSGGLSAQVAGTDDAKAMDSSISRLWAGLGYEARFSDNPRVPALKVRIGVAQMSYEVSDSTPAVPGVDDLTLTSAALGAMLSIALWPFLAPELTGEVRIPLRVRNSILEPYGAGAGNLLGYALSVAVRGRVIRGLGYRVHFSLEQFSGTLPPSGAGSALDFRDRFLSGGAALTYEL